MNLDEYQNEAKRTAARPLDAYPAPLRVALTHVDRGTADALLNTFDVLIFANGLAGEAGEVCDLLKKFNGHGKRFDGEKLKLELGDVLWYLANLADAHGFTLSEVAEANVSKLRARYPAGFSVAEANASKSSERVDSGRSGAGGAQKPFSPSDCRDCGEIMGHGHDCPPDEDAPMPPKDGCFHLERSFGGGSCLRCGWKAPVEKITYAPLTSKCSAAGAYVCDMERPCRVCTCTEEDCFCP